MTKADRYMYELLTKILNEGTRDENPRTVWYNDKPAHTISIPHTFRSYNIAEGELPLLTLRPINVKNFINEILWIYQNQTSDLEVLKNKYGINYWNSWSTKDGTIGNRYGHTVRKYDIINDILVDLTENPFGRRKVIDLYQYSDLRSSEGLYPCAFNFMLNVRKEGGIMYLDGLLVQRSGDAISASAPGCANEVQYYALLLMLARATGYQPGIFSHVVNNEHIYDKHIPVAKELIKRYKNNTDTYGTKQPILTLEDKPLSFYDITFEDFTFKNYNPTQPQLKFPVAI